MSHPALVSSMPARQARALPRLSCALIAMLVGLPVALVFAAWHAQGWVQSTLVGVALGAALGCGFARRQLAYLRPTPSAPAFARDSDAHPAHGCITHAAPDAAPATTPAAFAVDNWRALDVLTARAQAGVDVTRRQAETVRGSVCEQADAARLAADLSRSASDIATQGGVAVEAVVSAMQSLAERSREISEIVAVIDQIAFQTNILALNAAVEAARAGPQGRGFAVVAAEVRALAQHSAGSARQIRGLVEHSVSRMSSGATHAREAGATMAELVAQVQQVHVLLEEIASDTQAQTERIGCIADALVSLDDTVRQQTALCRTALSAVGAG
ncbi:hypothetical protein GTZ97_01005 [Aquabacterium fontiphilum]|nr:hypothetical protein [Aquabacterium fontiphilum]